MCAMIYTGGTVVGTPELTHGQTGTAKLVFRIREEREQGGKVYVDEAVVELWGEPAERYANVVDEGTVVKLKGFPRAEGRLTPDGKPMGYLVVKARELEIVQAARAPAAAQVDEQTVGDEDPFGNQ